MKKKVLALTMVMAIAASMAACGNSSTGTSTSGTETSGAETSTDAGAPAKTIWKVAFNQTMDHPSAKATVNFGAKFKEATGGEYDFEVYPSEQLGPQRETIEQTQAGVIEMALSGNQQLSSFYKEFAAFELPFVFNDADAQVKFFEESPIVEELYKMPEEIGLHIATFYHAGTRNMYAKDPIRTLEDVKGKKIRTMESDTYVKMMEYLGGAATPMSQGEVYTAIQSGVVDGAENNESVYYRLKQYEVGPVYSYTKHLIVPDYLLINADLYNGLKDEWKSAFDKLAKEAAAEEYAMWAEEVDYCKAEAEKGGATFVEDVDVDAFRKACEPLTAELTQDPAIKKVYDAIQESQNA